MDPDVSEEDPVQWITGITGRGTLQAEAHYRQRYIIGRGYLSSGWSKSRTALHGHGLAFFLSYNVEGL